MITRAVVSPIPPGQRPGRPRREMCANSLTFPLGVICTIVDPVPCWFPELLKLLTSTLPRRSRPWLCPITATPYGLTSPFAGIVDAILTVRWNRARNGGLTCDGPAACGEANAGPVIGPAQAKAAVPTAARAKQRNRRIIVLLPRRTG